MIVKVVCRIIQNRVDLCVCLANISFRSETKRINRVGPVPDYNIYSKNKIISTNSILNNTWARKKKSK